MAVHVERYRMVAVRTVSTIRGASPAMRCEGVGEKCLATPVGGQTSAESAPYVSVTLVYRCSVHAVVHASTIVQGLLDCVRIVLHTITNATLAAAAGH